MLNILIFLFVLSVLILIHEFGHFIAAKKTGVRIEQFSLGFGPVLFRKKKGGTWYSIGIFPLGGFVKLAGDNLEEYTGAQDEYYSQKPGRRFWIIFCGPLLNYLLGIFLFWVILFWGYPTLTTKVGGVIDGFGAKEAGVIAGDRILAVDGQSVTYWEDLQRQISFKRDQDSVQVLLLRDSREVSLSVRIKETKMSDQIGQKRSLGILGVTPLGEAVIVRHGFLESLGLSFRKAADLTLTTYRALWYLATGRLSMRDSMAGPLGIFFITSKAASLGVIALLNLMAVLSLSLAIFNLLPLPILDCGHIALLGLEKIRKKFLSIKTEQVINKVGITLIVSIALFVTYNDIVKNFGDKICKLFLR